MRSTRPRWPLPEGLPLDRSPHERPVLGPRPVVVLDVLPPEKLVEDEPRVRGALSDPAVRDDLAALGHSLALVQRSELVGVLERPVIVRRLAPGDVPCTGDVPRDLGLFLGKMIGGQLLAPILLRGPHVDEYGSASLLDARKD